MKKKIIISVEQVAFAKEVINFQGSLSCQGAMLCSTLGNTGSQGA